MLEREARIERGGPAKAPRCFLVVLLLPECDAEAVLRNRRTWLRDHRTARQGFGVLRLVFLAVNLLEKQKRVEILRVEDEDSPDRGLSRPEPTVDEEAMSSRIGPLLPVFLGSAQAQASIFKGLAVSGWHTAAIAMRLPVTGGLPLANGIIGLGGEIAWPRPTRPGDGLHVDSEVFDITPSRSKPNQTVVSVRSTMRNQKDEPVYVLNAKVLVFKRP